MKTAWKNLTKDNPDKTEDFKGAWADGKNFRDFLIELLEGRLEAARNAKERDNYDLENWSYKQADSNGSIRTYKEIIELLK